MKHLLVTGGAGFIGSHMVQALQNDGHQVVVFDNLERGRREVLGNTELLQGDLCNTGDIDGALALNHFDAVLHFAALAYVGESVHDPVRYYRNNVGGTLNLIDAMNTHGVHNLVFSSTCATYGVPSSLPITEETDQQPINPYGRSKLMVEHMLADQATAHGLNSIALRYFNAAGCSAEGSLGEQHDPETHLIPLILFEALRRQQGGAAADTTLSVFGSDFPTRDGTCIRDYIHVSDLCAAHSLALQRLFEHPTLGAEQYNLGTNHGYTVLEVIDACREVTGVDITFNAVDRRDGDPPELVADARKAMQTLGWTPAHTDIHTSIQHAWRWFSEHGIPSANG